MASPKEFIIPLNDRVNLLIPNNAVCLGKLCVKEMGGCYVPVGENGIESITKEEYEREVKVEVAVKMEILKA
ncbi:unnamed protein product [Brugia timori]|uniref:Uncharacterized protein n=1 Tax=Brugia timori TaxID=42155 RepID=A0A0R3Q5R9_9BILA|nr:unnamed protein product [Brugia timori]